MNGCKPLSFIDKRYELRFPSLFGMLEDTYVHTVFQDAWATQFTTCEYKIDSF